MKVLSQRPLTGCYCGNGRPLGRPPPLGVTLPFLLFIRAHFLICFIALLVVRIVQHLMGKNALSAERIARALNAATCRVFKGGIIHLDDMGGAIEFEKTKNNRVKLWTH